MMGERFRGRTLEWINTCEVGGWVSRLIGTLSQEQDLQENSLIHPIP